MGCRLLMCTTNMWYCVCSSEQLQRQVLRCYIDSNPHIKWCPRPNCNFSISLADQIRKHSVSPTALNTGAFTVHCACGHAFCWNCLEEAHEPASCDQVCFRLLDDVCIM